MESFIPEIGPFLPVDNSNNITWTKIITWSEEERLKVDVNADVFAMKQYDIEKISRYLGDKTAKNFKKKSFKQFNYLTVEPPTWAVTTTYLVTFLLTLGLAIFAVMNDINLSNNESRRRY